MDIGGDTHGFSLGFGASFECLEKKGQGANRGAKARAEDHDFGGSHMGARFWGKGAEPSIQSGTNLSAGDGRGLVSEKENPGLGDGFALGVQDSSRNFDGCPNGKMFQRIFAFIESLGGLGCRKGGAKKDGCQNSFLFMHQKRDIGVPRERRDAEDRVPALGDGALKPGLQGIGEKKTGPQPFQMKVLAIDLFPGLDPFEPDEGDWKGV